MSDKGSRGRGGFGNFSDDEFDDFDGFENLDAPFDYKYPESSKTSPNRKQDIYEGVEYITSDGAKRPSKNRDGIKGRQGGAPVRQGGVQQPKSKARGGGAAHGTVKRKVKNQSQSAMFMAIIVGVGVMLCLERFFLCSVLQDQKALLMCLIP